MIHVVLIIKALVADKLQLYYRSRQQKRYEQRCRETYEKYWQQIRRKELHKREREKYPLFYWRELIEEKLEDAE